VGRGCNALPAVVAATTTFELVEPQAPLTESLMQEPFVLVSSDRVLCMLSSLKAVPFNKEF